MTEFVECPRCLGKGRVEWEDIDRLNNRGFWCPGVCRYCAGNGKLQKSLVNVQRPVDNRYDVNVKGIGSERLAES